MHTSRSSRAGATYVVVALLVLVGSWFVVARPLAAVDTATRAVPTSGVSAAASTRVPTARSSTIEPPAADPTRAPASTTPTIGDTSSPTACREGTPARLVIPSLDVDAPFEQIGLDATAPVDAQGRHPLGNPRDRTKAGWYADGPRPGAGRGTVLTNGHTYRNNSAIFREDFASRVAAGQLIHIDQDNGTRCSYEIDRVWPEVDAERDYPRIVTSEHLYDFDGPERLFLATCGGSWNAAAQDYDQISLLIASPVDR